LALSNPSDVRGDPLINRTLGNLLIYSHCFVGYSGASITTN